MLTCSAGQDVTEDHTLDLPPLTPPGSTFDWEKQWYPLAFIEDLDPKVRAPHIVPACPSYTITRRVMLHRRQCASITQLTPEAPQGTSARPLLVSMDLLLHHAPEGMIAGMLPCVQVPTPVQVLGQRLVLWRDNTQQWRCFADVCPHRLAPLSGVLGYKDTHPSPDAWYLRCTPSLYDQEQKHCQTPSSVPETP